MKSPSAPSPLDGDAVLIDGATAIDGSKYRCSKRRAFDNYIVGRYYSGMVKISNETYARLLAIRTGMRQFERWSEQQAKAAGLTAAQHQLLLAIRGHQDPRGPNIGEVANYLLLRHHSVVGLIDRAEAMGLIIRTRDDDDRRIVRMTLSPDGARRLEKLSALHVEELKRLGSHFSAVSEGLPPEQPFHGRTVSR